MNDTDADYLFPSWYNDSVPDNLSSTELPDNADAVRLAKDISYLYISPVIISIGVFGDLMNVLVLSHPVLRKTSVVYSYLLALSVTDLLAHFSVIPMLLWILGYRLCTKTAAFYYAHFGFPLANAFMGASVWIVVFITLGQYIAVCHPFVQTFRSKRICTLVTVSAYVFSFTVYLPWMWKKRVWFNPTNGHCPYIAVDDSSIMDTAWFHAYQLTRETISRFVPFLFIVYFNVRIMFVYRRSKTHRLSVVGEHQKLNVKQKTEREERRLWYLLLAVMTIFFVCTLPAAVFSILVSDKYERNLPFQIIRSVSNILEFTKFALNFYLYCMINPDIRRLFVIRCASLMSVCCCCCVATYRNALIRYRKTFPGRRRYFKSAKKCVAEANSNYSYTLCTNGVNDDRVSGYYSLRNVKRKTAISKGSRQTLSNLLMDEDVAYKSRAKKCLPSLSPASSVRDHHQPVERKISEPPDDMSNHQARSHPTCRKTVSFKDTRPTCIDEERDSEPIAASRLKSYFGNNTAKTVGTSAGERADSLNAEPKHRSVSDQQKDVKYHVTSNSTAILDSINRGAIKSKTMYFNMDDSFLDLYETKV